ncbi:MAG: glycosyltransferase family 4 protein [Armatimonadetes bacterium]|nr:glycosyltransferase family 4 protein [Armatimonadota bacterium]
MKVALLHRQPFGGIATYVSLLAAELAKHDIQATIIEASIRIPAETGLRVDKGVSAWLKEAVGEADLVHAFGYRPAWACGEAFGFDEAWVYTAFDIPKTTHPQLIDRLNRSQCGTCASNAIWRSLDNSFAMDLSIVYPGVVTDRETALTKQEARAQLGIPESALLVGGMGRWEVGCGLRELIDSMVHVQAAHPEARLAIAGQGPEEGELRHRIEGLADPERVHLLGHVPDATTFLSALDLFVAPKARAGTSMGVLEAMAEGVPVLVRGVDGLPELIIEDVSGFVFDSDEALGARITELLSMEMTLETVGRAGRLRALERFTIEQSAQSIVEMYRTVTQDLL